MPLTDYHAKHFSYELTKRCPADSIEKLAGALVDAQVDLNPHQVETVLRVIVNPTRVPLAVVTVYFDRKMRNRL